MTKPITELQWVRQLVLERQRQGNDIPTWLALEWIDEAIRRSAVEPEARQLTDEENAQMDRDLMTAIAEPRAPIKTWRERCEQHGDMAVVSHSMVQQRMQEEIDDLRAALNRPAEPECEHTGVQTVLACVKCGRVVETSKGITAAGLAALEGRPAEPKAKLYRVFNTHLDAEHPHGSQGPRPEDNWSVVQLIDGDPL